MRKCVCMIQGGGAGSPALFGLQIIRLIVGNIRCFRGDAY